jgi:hypothetical protein
MNRWNGRKVRHDLNTNNSFITSAPHMPRGASEQDSIAILQEARSPRNNVIIQELGVLTKTNAASNTSRISTVTKAVQNGFIIQATTLAHSRCRKVIPSVIG